LCRCSVGRFGYGWGAPALGCGVDATSGSAAALIRAEEGDTTCDTAGAEGGFADDSCTEGRTFGAGFGDPPVGCCGAAIAFVTADTLGVLLGLKDLPPPGLLEKKEYALLDGVGEIEARRRGSILLIVFGSYVCNR